MTRIGIDAHVLVGKMQGSRTWLVNVVGRAVARHPDATYVIYSDDPVRAATMIAGANVEHVRLPRVPRALRLLAVWPWLVHRDRIDALLTTYIAPPLVPGARQVVVVHDILFETHPAFFAFGMRWRTRLLTRLGAKRARLVVTISRYSRDSIARTYRIDPDRIVEVRCGTSPPRTGAITRSPIRDGRPYLMMVGRLEPRKNLALTLDAFARLSPGAARLVVVGKPDGENPETLARLSSMADVVHVAGIDDRGLGDLYANAAALVFPSAGEGWGIPVLESLALGTPVVVSDACAGREAVIDGETGFLFRSGDDALAARMGRAAHARYWAAPMTIARHAEASAALYAGLRRTPRDAMQQEPAGIAAERPALHPL
ncbi:glycosyltransferase family 4 protein [Methylobacterium sp. WL122]|nr:glycosyltransferase family 4 protein [Methylobacterium sp. WL122]